MVWREYRFDSVAGHHTLCPIRSNGKTPPLHGGDGGSIPSSGTTNEMKMEPEDDKLSKAGFRGAYGEVVMSKYGNLQIIDTVSLVDVDYIVGQNRYGVMHLLTVAEANTSRYEPPRTTW